VILSRRRGLKMAKGKFKFLESKILSRLLSTSRPVNETSRNFYDSLPP
jgi:hypothetical protein